MSLSTFNDPDRKSARDEIRDLIRVVTFLAILCGIALLFAVAYAYAAKGSVGAAVLWPLALSMSGLLVGFLFGIPKVLQRDTSAPRTDARAPRDGGVAAPTPERAQSYAQRINTNLEEISDWLTKIIVGLGLVELKAIPGYVTTLAAAIAPAFGAGEHRSFALGLTVFFTIAGFLFGYLVTRLYLSAALARADRNAQDTAAGVGVAVLQLASLQERQQVIGGTARAAAAAPAVADPKKGLEELKKLAAEYAAVRIDDWGQRTRKKNALVASMFEVAHAFGVTKEALADAQDEGFTAALATSVNADPAPGDVGLLLRAGRGVRRLHVRYKVVVAFGALLNAGLVAPTERAPIAVLLRDYKRGADESLVKSIETLEAVLSESAAAA